MQLHEVDPATLKSLEKVKSAGERCVPLFRRLIEDLHWLEQNQERADEPATPQQLATWRLERDRRRAEAEADHARQLEVTNRARAAQGLPPIAGFASGAPSSGVRGVRVDPTDHPPKY